MRSIPVGRSFLCRSKGWPAATVFNPAICRRQGQGWQSSSAPREHLLPENDGKLTMYWRGSCKASRKQKWGKSSPGRRRENGKGAYLMPSAVRRILFCWETTRRGRSPELKGQLWSLQTPFCPQRLSQVVRKIQSAVYKAPDGACF